jgi:hypothetical protein
MTSMLNHGSPRTLAFKSSNPIPMPVCTRSHGMMASLSMPTMKCNLAAMSTFPVSDDNGCALPMRRANDTRFSIREIDKIKQKFQVHFTPTDNSYTLNVPDYLQVYKLELMVKFWSGHVFADTKFGFHKNSIHWLLLSTQNSLLQTIKTVH